MQGTTELSKELSAREIFNKIVKGCVVRIPNDALLAKQIHNHLNVIKSREKKIFSDLGLDFISSVISVEKITLYKGVKTEHGQIIPMPLLQPFTEAYEIKLIAPKKRRTYPTFSIQEEPNGSPSPV